MKTKPNTYLIKKSKRGFTLVEMLLVVTIIGILAALVLPNIIGKGKDAMITAARSDINAGIKSALGMYEVDNGEFPQRLDDLVQAPNNATKWHGPYLDKIPADPWGNTYVYVYPGKHGPYYDLYSLGPDKQDGTEDDITNWEK